MTSATLVEWNRGVGDRVEKGDVICEIETAKGNIDVEVWQGGVITELMVEPGQKVPVGEVMALIDIGAEAGAAGPAAEMPSPAAAPPGPAAEMPSPAAVPPGPAAQMSGPAAEVPSPAAVPPGPAAQMSGPTAEVPSPAAVPPGHAAQMSGSAAELPGLEAVVPPGPAAQMSGPAAEIPGLEAVVPPGPAPGLQPRPQAGEQLPVPQSRPKLGPESGPAARPSAPPATVPPDQPEQPEAAPPRPSGATPVSASPAARRRAAELGIPLWSIAGSGPRGAIKLEDVDRAAELGIPLQSIAGSGPGGPIKLDDVDNLATPGHRNVTPVARKMAAAEGVDLDAIEATGPHDTVTKEDVRRATLALRSPSTSQPLTSQPLTSQNPLRDAIARAMAKSKREIPHYYLRSTFDVSDAMEWMTAYNAARPIGERLIFGALVAKATALAAHDVPEVNGFYDDGFRPIAPVHLGFAVAMRGGGVVAPAIHDLASRSLDDVMRAIKDLVARVRGGKLRSSEMTDATITLTSLGDQGVDTVFGVIYPPQVAIVGFGSPRDMPFARDGMIGIHTCADVTMSGDHRVSDGLTGARFLQRIDYHLSHPEQL